MRGFVIDVSPLCDFLATFAADVCFNILVTTTGLSRQIRMRLAVLVILSAVSLSGQISTSGDSPDADPPVSQNDIRVVRRARDILVSPAKWNRADSRQCPANESTCSLYCALEQATQEISKKFEHSGAAAQQARFLIDDDLAKGNHYQHRLMDSNNDPKTTFSDVQRLFALLEQRIQKRLDAQNRQ